MSYYSALKRVFARTVSRRRLVQYAYETEAETFKWNHNGNRPFVAAAFRPPAVLMVHPPLPWGRGFNLAYIFHKESSCKQVNYPPSR